MTYTGKITLYGAAWCVDCKRSKDLMDKNSVPYDYIDIELVPGAAEKVAEINNGYKSIPTIVFEDGTVLVEPSNKVLSDKLGL